MRKIFETKENVSDFEIYINKDNEVIFNSERSDINIFGQFCFQMGLDELILFRDEINAIIDSIHQFHKIENNGKK